MANKTHIAGGLA